MKAAVIGAGWAGAAAAYQLHKKGINTTVFEASHTIGGRARKHSSKTLQQVVDNGQHLLLGAYSSTLALMQELQIDLGRSFYRFDLDIQSADESFRFKTAPLPAPFHLLGPLLFAKGTRFSERLALIGLQSYLRKNHWKVPSGMTVLALLQHTKQPEVLIKKLWHPLCIAALNTPIDQACAQLFSHVLRDSLGGSRGDTQMLIPLQNMTELWADRALRHADVRLGRAVRSLIQVSSGYELNGEHFDAVIIATNTPSAIRLMHPLVSDRQQREFVRALSQISFNPIATLYLQPESAWENPYPMLMLDEDTQGLAAGQWVFNHAAMPGSALQNIIAVTISYANRLLDYDKKAIESAIIKQINAQSQVALPPLLSSELITEKRATFVASPCLVRPDLHTPWPTLFLAGDWIANDYPAVLEGAVRSGLAAANALYSSLY